MALRKQNSTIEPLSQNDFQSLLQEQIRMAVRLTLTAILEDEVSALVGALPYQRTPERRDYRNGYYTRDLETTVGRIEDLTVPRTRNGYQTHLFDQYQRRRAELDEVISEMCHLSAYNVPGILTHIVPQVLTKGVPVVFTKDAPAIFTKTVPPVFTSDVPARW